MHRRAFCRKSLAAIVGLPALALTGALTNRAMAVTVATLKDQLEKGLRCRRPVEFAFVGKVIDLVNQRKLPVPLVTGTYDYARRKQPYPFPYFEAALRARAAKIGVVI